MPVVSVCFGDTEILTAETDNPFPERVRVDEVLDLFRLFNLELREERQ
jgi:hypothetical protein